MARSIASSSSVASPSSSAWSPAPSSKSRELRESSPASPACSIKPKGGPIDKRKRLAANARERKRMNLLNKAYDQLRKRLNDAENKSKYDVLVQAKEYIQALAKICADHDRAQATAGAPSSGGGLALKVAQAEQGDTTNELAARAGQIEASARLAAAAHQEARREHRTLTIATARPAHPQQQQQQQPLALVQSPSSTSGSSDCCLSPMSLADSVASSCSSHCSSLRAHQQFHYHTQPPAAVHLARDTPAALLLQTNRIKQEALTDEHDNYHYHRQHQIYQRHPHHQSLFHIHHANQQQQQQATL